MAIGKQLSILGALRATSTPKGVPPWRPFPSIVEVWQAPPKIKPSNSWLSAINLILSFCKKLWGRKRMLWRFWILCSSIGIFLDLMPMVDRGSSGRLEHSQCKCLKLLGLCFRPESGCSCSEPGDVDDGHKLICSLSRSDSFLGLSFSKDIMKLELILGGDLNFSLGQWKCGGQKLVLT